MMKKNQPYRIIAAILLVAAVLVIVSLTGSQDPDAVTPAADTAVPVIAASSASFLCQALKQAGLSFKDITPVNIDYKTAYPKLQKGEIDAIVADYDTSAGCWIAAGYNRGSNHDRKRTSRLGPATGYYR
jgi:ABC-type nitrate/sulfonate/bicarbonate transport system substrate-binding protein